MTDSKNAYEEAEGMICYAIEERDDLPAIREYLHTINYMLLKINAEKLKGMRP